MRHGHLILWMIALVESTAEFRSSLDGHEADLEAVECAFGMDVDYARLHEDIRRSDRC